MPARDKKTYFKKYYEQNKEHLKAYSRERYRLLTGKNVKCQFCHTLICLDNIKQHAETCINKQPCTGITKTNGKVVVTFK